MSKTMICLVCFFVVFGFCGTIASGQDNQIVNGEFDDDLDGWAFYGVVGINRADYNLEVVQDAGLSGSNAVMIDITDASAGTAIGITQGGFTTESNFGLVQGQTYPIGFMAKAEQDREMLVLLQAYKGILEGGRNSGERRYGLLLNRKALASSIFMRTRIPPITRIGL